MNFKITILFIILAFLSGGIFYYFTTNESEDVSIGFTKYLWMILIS